MHVNTVLSWCEEALSLHPELSLVQPVGCKLTQMVRLSMKLSWRLATLFLAKTPLRMHLMPKLKESSSYLALAAYRFTGPHQELLDHCLWILVGNDLVNAKCDDDSLGFGMRCILEGVYARKRVASLQLSFMLSLTIWVSLQQTGCTKLSSGCKLRASSSLIHCRSNHTYDHPITVI